MSAFGLRGYQEEIVSVARALMMKKVRRILLEAPTGSGKTVLASHMLRTAASKGMRSIFVCHRRELIKQSTTTFSACGVPHGVIAAGVPADYGMMINIASVNTLARRTHMIRNPMLFIWDECHHIAAKSWADIFRAFPNSFHIGLTATPERLDGKGLGDYFDEMVKGPSVRWLIDEGYLCDYEIWNPPMVSTKGLHVRMGDFVKSEVASLYSKPHIVGDSIKLYQQRMNGRRAIMFAPSIAQSEIFIEGFNAAGISGHHVDGETHDFLRDLYIGNFKSDKAKILSNVGLFGEGFDVPAVDGVIDAAPTMSIAAYRQRFGRCLRPNYVRGMPLDTKEQRLAAILASDKKFATYLDQAGNVSLHGLPDEVINWNLDGRPESNRKSLNEVKIRTCEKCYAAMPPASKTCQWCGYVFAINARTVEQVSGDLVKLNTEEFKKQRAEKKPHAYQNNWKFNSEAELAEEGKRLGYKRPELWARHVWRVRNAHRK